MRLSWNEVRVRAAAFAEDWKDAAYEKSETQSFYNASNSRQWPRTRCRNAISRQFRRSGQAIGANSRTFSPLAGIAATTPSSTYSEVEAALETQALVRCIDQTTCA